MDAPAPRRTLLVANRTAQTPVLIQEVERRASERPTAFALLIPNIPRKGGGDWTLERAIPLLERAARGPVEGLVGGPDPFESVKQALEEHDFHDVLISTLSKIASEWLRRDLPRRVERLGIPVSVITAREEATPARLP